MTDDGFQLIDDYLDEEISDGDLQRLEHWMRESPENVRTFVRTSFLHRQLRDLTVGSQSHQALATISTPAVVASLAATRPRRRRIGLWAAAVLLLISLIVSYSQWDRVAELFLPPTFGRLTGAIDCQWAQGQRLTSEGRLRRGDRLEVVQGLVEVTLDAGARMIVKGPATLEIVNDRQIKLEHGKMWTVVPESSPRFTVETPGSQIVDLGTEFGVDVKNERLTEAYVFRGRVEAGLLDTAGRVVTGKPLHQDEAAMIYVRDGQIRSVKSAPYLFARELRRSELLTPVIHEELEGVASFESSEVEQSPSAANPDQRATLEEAVFDVRITTQGDYQLWFYGTGPASFSETFDVRVGRLEEFRAAEESENAVARTTHIGTIYDGKTQWTIVRWVGNKSAIPLEQGEYRLRVTGRDVASAISRITVQLNSLPAPNRNG